jgi:hypothetical protein
MLHDFKNIRNSGQLKCYLVEYFKLTISRISIFSNPK